MPYIVRDAQGQRLGVLPDALPEAGGMRETFSPAGSRADVVPAGEPWTTPSYAPGTGALEVYLDGVYCAAGAPSEAIVFTFDIGTDFDVLVRVRR